MIKTMAGPGGSYAAGSVCYFPDDVAAELEAAGAAQILKDPPPAPAPEAAALETVEKAVKPAATRRKRAPRRKKTT